jgi:hypothetical protein
MGNRSKALFYLLIGSIGGLFIGGSVGELVGLGTGAIFWLFGPGEIPTSQLIWIGRLLGLADGTILGAVLLSLARSMIGSAESLIPGILICAVLGLGAAILFGTSVPSDPAISADSMIFTGAVGVWTGIATGGFVGISTALRAAGNRVVVSEEDKKSDAEYARFLKEKASRKQIDRWQ